MRVLAFVAIGILSAMTISGCGKSDNTVVEELVDYEKKALKILETVSDDASGKKADAELKKLKEEAEDLNKIVRTWPKEKKEELAKKHNLDDLGKQVEAAYEKARKYLPKS